MRERVKMSKLIRQIIRFGFVGGTAFVIDFGVFWILTEFAGINYLLSNIIAFTVSVIYNYILSIYWVFDTKKTGNKVFEAVVFIVLSVVGLGINEAIIWLCVDKLTLHSLLSKIIATAIVMVYNFITRKLFLEKREK